MAYTYLSILGDSGNKIQAEPTVIRAEGSPEYTRLVVPISLDLKPINEKNFSILGIRASLFIQNNPQKISDALPHIFSHTISKYPQMITRDIEFPLDAFRIEKIEEQRKGVDLKIRLDLYFIIGIYEPLIVKSEGAQKTKDFLAEILTSFVQLQEIKIPQSHWVKDILPKMGHSECLLVEIPKGNEIIREAWDYIEKTETAFMRWDTQGVFANCREVGRVLDNEIKNKFGEADATYTERWQRFHKGFNHWASLDLHRTDIKVEVKKADAEHLMFVTKSLIKFAEQLLREKNK